MELRAEGRSGSGVRAIASLKRDDAHLLGEEAADLARLAESGVPLGDAWVVPVAGDDPAGRIGAVVEQALATPGRAVALRPWLGTRAATLRAGPRWPVLPAIETAGDIGPRVRELLESLTAPAMLAALGGSLSPLRVRVVAVGGVMGSAASVEPRTGDPDRLAVWAPGSGPWEVDRRTMRVERVGQGAVDETLAARASDLVDRAQLVLGKPVEIDWSSPAGRPLVHAVRTVQVDPCFTTASYRRVALVAADEGTVAPLAVDTLDKALRRDDDPVDEPRVRRIYSRPYRRIDGAAARGLVEDSLAKATARAARVAVDVSAPLLAASRFERSVVETLTQLDAEDLRALDDATLIGSLRTRQRLAVDAFALMDRALRASLAILPVLEAVCGTVPRDAFADLAALRLTRSRRRALDRLARLAEKIENEHGDVVPPERLSAALRTRWQETRRTLGTLRPLGIDVCPRPFADDEATMLEAVRMARTARDEARERARRDATRRLLATARGRPLGRAREALAGSMLVLLARVADAKGAVGDGLAAALLRLRFGAIEAGRRLVDAGVLDAAEDALYLDLGEIADALQGEPGAYAARVRLRREDDARWAAYEAPQRVHGRERG